MWLLSFFSQGANLGKSERSVSSPWPVASGRECPLSGTVWEARVGVENGHRYVMGGAHQAELDLLAAQPRHQAA